DLAARSGLSYRRPAWRQRRRMATRKRPILVEDPHQARDLRYISSFQDIVVIAIAVRTPVHPADDSLAVGDEELDVIDLVTDVVNRIDAYGDPERIEGGRRLPARQNRRIRDHAHRDASRTS